MDTIYQRAFLAILTCGTTRSDERIPGILFDRSSYTFKFKAVSYSITMNEPVDGSVHSSIPDLSNGLRVAGVFRNSASPSDVSF